MYIIIKSADNQFVTQYIDGQIGQRYNAAQQLAKEVNEAVLALKEVKRLFGTNWIEELNRLEEIVRDM